MKTESYIRLWNALRKRYLKLRIAAIGMIALCVMSCRSQQNLQIQSDYQADSLLTRKRAELTLMPVPPSRAKLRLTVPQIESLPVGAGYIHRSERATINITKAKGDTLYLTATCDSLQRQYLLLEEELIRIRDSSTHQSVSLMTGGPTGWESFWIRFGKCSAIVFSFVLIMKMKKSNSFFCWMKLEREVLRLWILFIYAELSF